MKSWLIFSFSLVAIFSFFCIVKQITKLNSEERIQTTQNEILNSVIEKASSSSEMDLSGESKLMNSDMWNDPYTVVSSKYKNEENQMITFPAISGLSDTGIQEQINAILLENALFYLNTQTENTLNISYEVKRSDSVLSVAYYGNIYYPNTPHPHNYFYTINIDVATGENIDSSQIFTSDRDALLKALQSTWVQSAKADDIAVIKLFLRDEISGGMWDSVDSTMPDAPINVYSTTSGIGIRFYVPYAYGSYAIVEIPNC